jgi:hypothetical protein
LTIYPALADHFGWLWHLLVVEAAALALLHPLLLRGIRMRRLSREGEQS